MPWIYHVFVTKVNALQGTWVGNEQADDLLKVDEEEALEGLALQSGWTESSFSEAGQLEIGKNAVALFLNTKPAW